MTSNISGVSSSSLLANYLDSTKNADLDAKTIFKKLSIEAGGDGKELTKDQLDSYIKKIEAGKAEASDEELSGLKDMQENWDSISKGSDSISYSNMSGYKDILTSMDAADKTSTIDLRQDAADSTAAAYGQVVDAALNFNAFENKSSSDLSSMLNNLLSGTTDENDDANADLIDQLTNLIAKFKDITSTIEVDA